MAPGLKRILDLIRVSPNDQMLVDRYIALANELPDIERVDATMRLAETLANKAPKKALEIAWTLFKKGERESESLGIIARSLEALGKLGRAAALRADSEKFLQDRSETPEKEKLRESIHRTVVLSTGAPSSGFSSPDGTKTSNTNAPTFSLVDSNSSTGSQDHQIGIQASPTPTPTPAKSNEPTPHQEDLGKRDSVAKISAATPGAGIPEAIPPKEPSKHSKSLQDRFDKGSTPSMNDVSSQALTIEAPDFLGGDIEKLRGHVRELMNTNRMEEILEVVEVHFKSRRDARLLDIFATFSLHKIDIRFAAAWIDILIAHQEERRALRFIHQALSEEPHLAWARMALSRLNRIAELLNLRPVQWREADGVASLRRQIELLRPKTAVYAVGFVIAS